jgi:diguanylate cyclase (GGDEF)-like protein
LRSEAISDSLTGLFNRRYLDATLDREIDRADRAHRSIGIIMLDIDDFKRLNDTHGHHVGDEVLRLVGGLLDRQTRAGDIVCRYGGEEFVLVLPEASLADTQARAETLLAAIRQLRHDVGDGNTASITMSGGVVALPEHGSDAATLLRLADQALYLAKAEGKDRLVTATIPGR